MNCGHALEREQPGARAGVPDQVVVRERVAIVAVGLGGDVAHRHPRRAARRARRPGRRQRALDARQPRLGQERRDAALRALAHRHAAEDLLVLDQLRAARAHPLQHQVEAVALVRGDAVVVDRGAQVFARARAAAAQAQRAAIGRQRDRGGAAAVDDAHDEGASRPPLSKYCSIA
ncbi:MAG: hypothetical protein U1F30_00215 [Steroidobacteraceae bacterium]